MEIYRETKEIPDRKRWLNTTIVLIFTTATVAAMWSADWLLSGVFFALFGIVIAFLIFKKKTEIVLTEAGLQAKKEAEAYAQARSQQAEGDFFSQVYQIGFVLTWMLTFFGSWIYCAVSYGYLLGVGLGWLPSLFVATLAAIFWPLIAAAIAVLLFVVLRSSQ